MKRVNNETVIALNRALGDHLLATPLIRVMSKKGCHIKVAAAQLHLLENNPYIDELVPLTQEYVKYICDPYCYGFQNQFYGKVSEAYCKLYSEELDEDKLEIYLTKSEDEWGRNYISKFKKPVIFISPYSGYANQNGRAIQVTKNRDWVYEYWTEVLSYFRDKYEFVQIGSKNEKVLPGISHTLFGESIRNVIAALKFTKTYIAMDSFWQHAGNAVGKRGIVLFNGGFHPYICGHDSNINLYSRCKLEICHKDNEPRGRWNIDLSQCPHKECMRRITPESVISAIRRIDENKKELIRELSKADAHYIGGNSFYIPRIVQQNKPRIEIEIPTCERMEYLLALLHALRFQTYRNWDLTIIDDNLDERMPRDFSIVETLKLIEKEGHRWKMWRGPRQGPPISHNRVLYGTEHEWILIIGDDNIPEPTYIEELVNALQGDNIAAVGGITLHNETYFHAYTKKEIEHRKESIFTPIQWKRHQDKSIKDSKHLYGGFLYRTDIGIAIGGFPRNLSNVGYREETDFTYRLHLSGFKMYVVPKAFQFHYRAPNGGIRCPEWMKKELYESDEKKFKEKLIRLHRDYYGEEKE